MIVTIDGPAGSGKSTAARKLAARLQIPYLDTGAMYRAIAFAATERGIDLDCGDSLLELARTIELVMDCGPTHTRVRVDGHDVSEAIRSMAVSAATSQVARCQGVRSVLVTRQREMGKKLGSVVSEGRDQGSVVFPNADVKFVLVATIEKRAERRLQEMIVDGGDVKLKDVISHLKCRDEIDAKQWEPLLASGKAVVIDTTDLTIAQLIDRMADIVRGASTAE